VGAVLAVGGDPEEKTEMRTGQRRGKQIAKKKKLVGNREERKMLTQEPTGQCQEFENEPVNKQN